MLTVLQEQPVWRDPGQGGGLLPAQLLCNQKDAAYLLTITSCNQKDAACLLTITRNGTFAVSPPQFGHLRSLLRCGLEFLFGLVRKLKNTCEILLRTSEGNLHADEHPTPLCFVSTFRINKPRTEMSLVASNGRLALHGWSSSPRNTQTNKALSPHKSIYSPIVSAFLVHLPEFHHLTKRH